MSVQDSSKQSVQSLPRRAAPKMISGTTVAPIGVQALVRTAKSTAQTKPVFAVPVRTDMPKDHWLAEALYRAFEFSSAFIVLFLSLPVLAVEALMVWLDSGRPILFRQFRTTCSDAVTGHDLRRRPDLKAPGGTFDPAQTYLVPKVFRFVKFRTMYSDAQQRFPELYAYEFPTDEFHTRRFKDEDDPRITPLGYHLRRLTIDELPNLWCVLTGEMRLVGPRPEHPNLLPYYNADEMYKFAVKPGITGLAQINGRGLLTFGETIAWDLEYVRTRSVWLDIKILFKTAWCVLIRRGAF